MLVIIITTIAICVLFTIVEVVSAKWNPLSGLHNLPSEIQKRVHSLPEYEGKALKILSTRERIVKKVPALVLLLFIFAAIVHMAGADSFLVGFLYTFGMWTMVKLYVTLVLMCGWYAHSPKVWIKGTEDMTNSYQNYAFYFKSIPRSLVAGFVVAVIIGVMMRFA